MRRSTWSWGVVLAVELFIVSSMYPVCTSRSVNCVSNLSMTADIFSKSIVRMATSMPCTTLPIEPVTLRMVTAVWTREVTASMRLLRRSRLRLSFFFRMAFAA